jgi:single-stranded-DNA-specific exonuclease
LKRFVVREGAVCAPNIVKAVQEATGLLEPVAALLCSRGIDTPEAARRFLHPGPEQLHDPFLLPDMAAAVDRIRRAVANHEKITVFCDYDADGTCGGSALYLHLRGAGADVSIQTPNRHKEGYGLSKGAVEQIAAGGGTLIITVDCGITNVAETELARRLGVDVVVTDHHECGEMLPDTPYIINAKRPDSTYPYRYLAGCGVAFKLIHALSSLAEAMRYIDLIAIGTITDIVPLLGENRVIAHMGLKKLRKNASAGVAALAQAAGISLPEISSLGIGFGLGPRINAAGRMDTAETAIEILTAKRPGPALKQSVAQLCALNERRRQEVCDILADAEKMIAAHGYQTDPAILLADKRWNAGVIGIAAAKLAEKYYRPCVLFGGEGDLIGSARSVPGVNIYEALGAFADSYEKFGGHAQAAGLTIRPERLNSLRADVCAYIRAHYDEAAFMPQKLYDMGLSAGDVTRRFVEDLARLEPFGPENEQPVFAIRDASLTGVRFVGRDKTHLKFTLKQGDRALGAVSFGFADTHALLPGHADLLCEAGIDSFTGRPQVIVRDFAPRFDDALLQSFLEDNAWRTADGLMNEVVRLMSEGAPEAAEAGFVRLADEALSVSHFGLCLVAATEPALKRLVAIEPVLAALKEGRLVLWDRKSFTPGNCIACGAVPGHPRVIHIGVTEPPAFFDDKLKEAYREEASRCFLKRDALLVIYRRMQPLLAKAQRTPRALASLLSLDVKKTAFALRVFAELELIDTDKNDKILSINGTGPRRELRDSAVYRSFEDLING